MGQWWQADTNTAEGEGECAALELNGAQVI